MSHIIFGDFYKMDINNNVIIELRNELSFYEMYIFINDEITFYDDIIRMFNENTEKSNNVRFCLTSNNQKYNSEDLLFPYDKYSNDCLFPNGIDDRQEFEKICLSNLEILNSGIMKLREILKPNNLRLFVTEGYDDEFEKLQCNQDELMYDIGKQVTKTFHLKSKIYYLQ